MKKFKITTEVDLNETEGLYNTTTDRWSRRAKHQLSKTELLNAADISEFSKGDTAVYEGQLVEVRIPTGPNFTSGIMLEGQLKMVKRSSLLRLDENYSVVSGVTALGPINRIMQLAGLEHSGTSSTDTNASAIVEDANRATSLFDQIYKQNLNAPAYKNNPNAAKLATIGGILAGLNDLIENLPADLSDDLQKQIQVLPAVGANLIKAATSLTKPMSGD